MSTSSVGTTAARRIAVVDQLRDLARRDPWRVASWLHWASLAAAGVFLAWADRHQWFSGDEWAFLTDRGLGGGGNTAGLLTPHNEHWSSLAIVVFRALFAVFGTRTYAPYIAVVIIAHLVLAHLLWCLLRRHSADAVVATGAIALFAVLGVGWENLAWAFQMTTVVPIALGVGALLVMGDETGPSLRRQLGAAALLVVALPWSGTGLVLAVIVGLCAWLRWGSRVALVVSAPALVVYAVWYAAEGRHAHGAGEQSLRIAVQAVPGFVWRGLVDAWEHALGLGGVGPVVIVLLTLFVLGRAARTRALSPTVVILAGGAALFLALTALRRSGLGVETAGSPRYSYVVIALMVPVAVFALDVALGRGPLRIAVAVVLGALLLVVQLSTFNDAARRYAAIEQEQKHRILATAELTRNGAPTLESQPVPDLAPNLSVGDVRRLDAEGELPGNVRTSRRDLLTASVWVQAALRERSRPGATPVLLDVDGARVEPGDAGCVRVAATGDRPEVALRLDTPGSVELRAPRATTLGVRLGDGEVVGRERELMLPGRATRWLALARAADVHLSVPATRELELCGVTGAP